MASDKQKSPREPKLSSEDRALWQHYTRDIKPLGGEQRTVYSPSPPQVTIIPQPPNTSSSLSAQHIAPSTPQNLRYQGRRRLKRPLIDGRLDLHGLVQADAQGKLERFLANAYEQGYRCVLVITGKGRPDPEHWWRPTGLLRENVPRWLNEAPNCHRVTCFTPARPEDGGTGSLYVYLRRSRKE